MTPREIYSVALGRRASSAPKRTRRIMADSVAASGENPSAVTEALGSAAEDVMTETGLEDPRRLVKNRLAERTREVCPAEADGILR